MLDTLLAKKGEMIKKRVGDSCFALECPPGFKSEHISTRKLVVEGAYPETGRKALDAVCYSNYYVIRGTGYAFVGDDEYVLEEGDVLHVPPRVKHQITGEDLHLLVSSAPPFDPKKHRVYWA